MIMFAIVRTTINFITLDVKVIGGLCGSRVGAVMLAS